MSLLNGLGRRLGRRPEGPEPIARATRQATWRGAVLAESDQTIVVEGNHYFPAESVRREFLRPSASHTACAWKGTASYYDVVVDGQVNRDAAWYYPDPSRAAERIRGRVAFWHGVKVRQRPEG
jgi:uncharacterized protein (DUF427 family)